MLQKFFTNNGHSLQLQPLQPSHAGDYIPSQNKFLFSVYLRHTTFEIMFDIGREFKFSNHTIHLALDLIDRVLALHCLQKETDFMYIYLGCLDIAAKYYEMDEIEHSELYKKSRDLFGNRKDIGTFVNNLIDFQKTILIVLQFTIYRKNIYSLCNDPEIAKSVVLDYELAKEPTAKLWNLIKVSQQFNKSVILKISAII